MESNTKEKSGESLFFPSFSVLSVYALDFHRLYEKGYRALFFDIDNTLVYHDEPALFETVKLFALLRSIGIQTAILSNNGESRVRRQYGRTTILQRRGNPGRMLIFVPCNIFL